MSVFMSPRLRFRVRCPVDGSEQTVELQTSPGHDGDFLDVVSCSSVGDARRLECGKGCRHSAATRTEYCRTAYLNALLYSGDR